MATDNEKILIKAEFYYTMNLKCHIKIKGLGFKMDLLFQVLSLMVNILILLI